MWRHAGMVGMGPTKMMVFVGLLAGCSDYEVHPNAQRSGLATALVAEPAVLDLGGVPLGDISTARVTLHNVGDDPVSLTNFVVLGSGGITADPPEAPFVEPGGMAEVPVRFQPGAFEDHAVMEVLYDTADRSEVLLSVPMEGIGLAGALAVEPGHIDLGMYPTDCVVEHAFEVRNIGTDRVELQEVAVVGEGFSLVDTGEQAVLEPGGVTEVVVQYTATGAEHATGEVWVHHDGVSGTVSAGMEASLMPRAYAEQTFLQDGPWDAVDILFAVDGSGSMEDDTARLAANARTFFQALHATGVDARVAGVTRDDGCINGGPLSTTDPGAEEAFARSLDGSWGIYTESLLTVAAHAMEAADGCNTGVFREDARTAVVVLSDEPDQSDDDWETYVARMRAVDPHVVISAIVGEAPDGCETAYPGYGYLDAASATDGATVSLCAEDWGPFLSLQAELVTGNPRTRFVLTEPAGPGPAYVTIDGEPVTDGWTLDWASNTLVFEEHAMPGPGAAIFVEYPVASDCDPLP